MSLPEAAPTPRCAGAEILRRANEEAAAEVLAESMEQVADAADVSFGDAPPPPGIRHFADEVPGEHPTLVLDPEVLGCDLCHGIVEVGVSHITMKKCVITNGCELAWGQQHPDFYDPTKHDPMNTPEKALTPPLLPCGGDRCSALIRFLSPEGEFLGADPKIEVGICGVDVAGAIWRERGIDTLNRMQPSESNDMDGGDGETLTARDIPTAREMLGITPGTADASPEAATAPQTAPQAPEES